MGDDDNTVEEAKADEVGGENPSTNIITVGQLNKNTHAKIIP